MAEFPPTNSPSLAVCRGAVIGFSATRFWAVSSRSSRLRADFVSLNGARVAPPGAPSPYAARQSASSGAPD